LTVRPQRSPGTRAEAMDIAAEREKKKHRHGRPRKTGRPGQ